MLRAHPPGSLDAESGLPFWSGTRRLPHCPPLDPADEAQRALVRAAARLRLDVLGVQDTTGISGVSGVSGVSDEQDVQDSSSVSDVSGVQYTPDVFGLYNAALTIIWVIVGGRGTLIGPVFATFALFYLTASLGQTQLNNNLVLGIILIVFVLLVPKGIAPTVTDWYNSRRRKSAPARRRRTPRSAEGPQ